METKNIVGIGIALGFAVLMVLGWLGSLGDRDPAKAIPRAEVLSMRGAHTDRLLEKFGRPRRTSTSGDTEYWYYDGVSRDTISGNIDNSTQFVIRSQHVESINF